MSKKRKGIALAVLGLLFVALSVAGILLGSGPKQESIKEVMLDAVLHETNKVRLFGMAVNPSVLSALTVTGVLLFAAALLRIFVIPRFTRIPGRFQQLLETLVGFFDNLAKTNSPHRNGFLGAYIFSAGVYIFVGTVFELFGLHENALVDSYMGVPIYFTDAITSLE